MPIVFFLGGSPKPADCKGIQAAVRGSPKPAVRREIMAAIRSSPKPADCKEIQAAVHGSLKSAGLYAVKPAGSNPRAPGYGVNPGVLGASPYSRAPSRARSSQAPLRACSSSARSSSARASRAPAKLLRFPQEFFWGGHVPWPSRLESLICPGGLP